MTKFYSIGDFGGYDTVSRLLDLAGMQEARTMYDADIIVFNGGADIGTEIYGERPAVRGVPWLKSERDEYEIDAFNRFVGDKFLLGICRGAQLLNCLNGGTLWQHVNNHTRTHKMVDLPSGKVIKTTSTHHQMMRPNLETGQVIAVASEATVKYADGVEREIVPAAMADGEDIEVVWYPKTRTLCVQGHPEYVPGSPFADYVLDLVEKFRAAA